MTDDIDITTLPDDVRDGEVDHGTEEGEPIDGADQPEVGADGADEAVNEDTEDEA